MVFDKFDDYLNEKHHSTYKTRDTIKSGAKTMIVGAAFGGYFGTSVFIENFAISGAAKLGYAAASALVGALIVTLSLPVAIAISYVGWLEGDTE